MLLSAAFRTSSVDHTAYDTTSILATIEDSVHVAPLSSRDFAVFDLRDAIRLGLAGRR